MYLVWGVLQLLASRRERDERGASLLEYLFLVSMIAVVCIVAIQFFGNSVSANMSASGSYVSAAH